MMPLCIFLALMYKICQVFAAYKDSTLIQDSGIKTAKVGDDLTLECSCRDDAVTFLSWYQQNLGGKPHIISSRMKHSSEVKVYPKYEKRFRVFVDSQKGTDNLIITNLSLSDSGTYYCGVLIFNAIEFGQGVFLHVKTSLMDVGSAVQPPEVKPLQLGDSLNLSCTVDAKSCAGEPNIYWFRHGASQPAVMYPSERQCTSLSEDMPHRKNCTSSLTIKSVDSSDAGTYYCALASCGEIIFGNGTRVEIRGSTKALPILVYCLSVALAVSIIVLLVLAFITYKLKAKLCTVCKGTVSHQSCSAPLDGMSQDEHNLHYAALSLKRGSERHRLEDNIDSACVYSRVKSRKM